MSVSPERLTAQHFVDAGLVWFPPLARNAPASRYTAFVNAFPDTPTNAIGFLNNGLNRPEGRLMDGRPVTHPGVQVRVRSSDMDDAYTMIKSIWDYAITVKRVGVTILTEEYRLDNLSVSGEPIYLGVGPDDQRPSYSFDLYVSYRKIGE